MNVIGIDPGKEGGIAIIDTTWAEMSGDPSPLTVHKMPATEHDVREILESIGRYRFAFIEAVSAMPGNGAVSMFTFGRSYGFLRGVLSALKLPFEDVRPLKWQTDLGCRSKGDKNATKATAQRLWPEVRFTHATADAALIAEYGRRTLAARGQL